MLNFAEILNNEETLDPQDWQGLRQLGHQMVDDMMDFLQSVKERPIWEKTAEETKAFLQHDLPEQPQNVEEIYKEFTQYILPFPKGNIHPRFWSWVQGTGTAFGMLADMLASGMNPNVAIGDHAAMYVENQVIEWSKQMLGYPASASGILLSGGSMANITGLTVARNYAANVRAQGLKAFPQMVLYCSSETHSCNLKAAEVLGLGAEAVRKIPVNEQFQIRISDLRQAIEQDLATGLFPFCVIGNAGTVNTAAIDDLDAIAEICKEFNLWFHVDGAFGALAKLTDEYAKPLKAIEIADSVAFDFHKWMYVNYEVGCLLVKDREKHRAAFAYSPNYLTIHERGLAAGPESLNNYGLELSRGFKALKVWMSLKEHGIDKYRRLIRQNIAQCFYLASLIEKTENLELMAPVSMNIVCYRFNPGGMSEEELNALNKEILMQLQEQGIAAPSSTILNGNYVIRVANTNHRSTKADFETLVAATVQLGKNFLQHSQPLQDL